MRPRVAFVSGLVNSETSLRVTRRVWLAGSSIERVIGRIVRKRANRVRGEATGDKCPVGRTA